MEVLYTTIIDEVTKGSIGASIVGCNSSYKSKEDNEVKTYLDIIFIMSDEILQFIKYAYDTEHKITLHVDAIGDAYKNMIVRSFGPADKSLLHAELIKIEPIEKKEDTTMRSTEHSKDVERLVREINKLNENSKGLIVDLGDYTEIKEGLERLQLTLLRNMKAYMEEMCSKLEEEISKM